MNQEDSVITKFLRSLGPWNQSIVIGGGYAPIIYSLYFAEGNVASGPIATRDIDSIIPRRIAPKSE